MVTSATFANAQYFLEDRPYKEDVKFLNLNPGMHWEPLSILSVDAQINMNRSTYQNLTPTVLINTPLGQGITVNYSNPGTPYPNTVDSNVNLNDPNAGWTWNGGRVNLANEKRLTKTDGAHVDLRFGDEKTNIKVGAAYDEVSRGISARNNDARWEDVVCRGGLDANGNSPTVNRAPCDGLNANAAIPQSRLHEYLAPGPAGFITVDFDKFKADSDYQRLFETAPENNSSSTGAGTGGINERTRGAYLEFNGEGSFMDRPIRFNVGGRYVTTDQAIINDFAGGLNAATEEGVRRTAYE